MVYDFDGAKAAAALWDAIARREDERQPPLPRRRGARIEMGAAFAPFTATTLAKFTGPLDR
eukprot:CAMPEP_0170178312 /NCGR_PEP_ID=MMETSP0040_2-20121228/11803_1 /TAXON_ID=641309 /ORGANISM="Lotharella oceanica, Strain CCMP622" /LENGTH=60 /DNA_ID=CAMNT_0010421339 /DNA_START=834 /DNA_END=1016 /DNA_ORIENTATION=-